MTVLLGVIRVLVDGGYLLLGGTFVFWALIGPRTQATGRLARLAGSGIALMIIGSVAAPVAELITGGLLGDVLTSSAGTALIIQLAALVAAAFFLPDLIVARPGEMISRWRRAVLLGLLLIIAITLSVRSDAVGDRWVGVEVASTTVHALATAAWLGGLVALVVVLTARGTLDGLAGPSGRFARIRLISLVLLVVTGVVQVLTTAGAAALVTGYGLVLLVKVVLLAAMVVVASYGRTHVARVTFRAAYVDGADGSRVGPSSAGAHTGAGVRAQVVVLRTELLLGLLVVVVTSLLVALTP